MRKNGIPANKMKTTIIINEKLNLKFTGSIFDFNRTTENITEYKSTSKVKSISEGADNSMFNNAIDMNDSSKYIIVISRFKSLLNMNKSKNEGMIATREIITKS
jgi:hypothetical protein